MFLALRLSPVVAGAVMALLSMGRLWGSTWSTLDTGLATLALITAVSDVATLVAARAQNLSGAWRRTWWAVGLEVFPVEPQTVPQRMREVGAAGLFVPWAVVLATSAWFFSGPAHWQTHSGAAVLASSFALLTCLVPQRARPASAGGVVERLWPPRWVRANWEWAGVLRSMLDGATLVQAVDPHRIGALVRPDDVTLTPLNLVHAVWCCERDEVDAARARFRAWADSNATSAPAWLAVDALKQASAFFALVDADVASALPCLRRVEALQQVPWYAELPAACVAHAQGDVPTRTACLERWDAGAMASPHAALLRSANAWILRRLTATPSHGDDPERPDRATKQT